MNPLPRHLLAAFAIAPWASAILFAIVATTIGVYETAFVDVGDVLSTFGIFMLVSAIYSYVFTLVFGLPIYFLWVRKKWFSLRHFLAGGLVAGILAIISYSFVTVAKFEVFSLSWISMIFFAMLNAFAMWLFLNRTSIPLVNRDAPQATRPLL